jgi:hypothetical protein
LLGLILISQVQAAYITQPDQLWTVLNNSIVPVNTDWKLGVGTSNPGSRLTIRGVGASNTPLTLLQVFNDIPYATGNGVGAARAEIGHSRMQGYIEAGSFNETNSDEGYLSLGILKPSNLVTEMIRMNHSGVGIGVTNPSTVLDIKHNLKITEGGTIYNNNNARWLDLSGVQADSLLVANNLHSTAGVLKTDGTGENIITGSLSIDGGLKRVTGGGSGANLITISAESWRSTTTMWKRKSGTENSKPTVVDPVNSAKIPTGKAHQFIYSGSSTGGVWYYLDQLIAINPGTTYYGRIWAARTQGSGTFYAGYRAYDKNMNALSGNTGTNGYFIAGGKNPDSNGTWYYGKIQGEGTSLTQFPVGTRYIQPLIITNYGFNASSVNGIMQVGGFEISDRPFEREDGSYEIVTQGSSNLFIKGGSGTDKGHIGIGTTNPGAKLDVAGSFRANSATISLLGGGGNKMVMVDSSGNLYSTTKLEIQGDIAMANWRIGGGKDFGGSGNSASAYLQLYNGSTGLTTLNNQSYGIDLQTATTSRLFIKNNGNIGIGTTDPNAKLDVAGSFRANSATISLLGGGGNKIVMTDNLGNLYSTSSSIATGLPTPTTSGSTLRSNGSAWIADTTLYNNGANIGIGTSNPRSIFDVGGYYSVHKISTSTSWTGSPTTNFLPLGRFAPSSSIKVTIGMGGNSLGGSGLEYLITRGYDKIPRVYYFGSNGFRVLPRGLDEYVEFYYKPINERNFDLGINFSGGSSDSSRSIDVTMSVVGSADFSSADTQINNYTKISTYQYIYNGFEGNVGIGTTAPKGQLHLYSSSVTTPNVNADDLVIEGSSSRGLSILSSSIGYILFGGGSSSSNAGQIAYDTTNKNIQLRYDVKPGITVNSSNYVGIGTTNPTTTLVVNGGTGNVIDVKGGLISGLNITPYNPDHAVSLDFLQKNYRSLIHPNIMDGRYSSFENFPLGESLCNPNTPDGSGRGEVSDDYSLDGSYSYKLTGNHTDGYCIPDANLSINVKPNTKYIFSYYAYRPSGNKASAQMYTRENGSALTHRGCTINKDTLGTGKWVRCSTVFTTAPDTTLLTLVRMDIDSDGSTSETIYFDAIQIEEAAEISTIPSAYRAPSFSLTASKIYIKDLDIGNKLTVGTIDPLYQIRGVNYSTFASALVGGVTEEIVGRIKLAERVGNEYQAVIDFSKEAEGSDLWVWYQVVDFNRNNVEVIMTPYGKLANTYYYIDGQKLILRADQSVEVSYRFTAKRFDWRNWPTKAQDQQERPSFIIN